MTELPPIILAAAVAHPPKKWYLSKTILFNIATLLVIAAGFIADNTGALALPPQTAVWATLVVALGNAALRLGTAAPIAGTPAAAAVAVPKP